MRRGWPFFTLLFLCAPGLVEATCRNYEAQQTGGEFSFTYVCESSFGAPAYTIVRNITEGSDLQVLEFAPREVGLICERYETPSFERADCRQREPLAGNVFEGRLGPFVVSELGPSFSDQFEAEYIFRYPASPQQVGGDGCAVALRPSGAVDLWISDDLHALSECLIRLELDLINHPGLLLRER